MARFPRPAASLGGPHARARAGSSAGGRGAARPEGAGGRGGQESRARALVLPLPGAPFLSPPSTRRQLPPTCSPSGRAFPSVPFPAALPECRLGMCVRARAPSSPTAGGGGRAGGLLGEVFEPSGLPRPHAWPCYRLPARPPLPPPARAPAAALMAGSAVHATSQSWRSDPRRAVRTSGADDGFFSRIFVGSAGEPREGQRGGQAGEGTQTPQCH